MTESGALERGNKHAQSYFVERIDLMLKENKREELMHFMQKWWPKFKMGVGLSQEATSAEQPPKGME